MRYTTIKDIARELGVSKSTVSRALRGDNKNVKKETQEKIIALAKEMGYRRNEMAVNLRLKSTKSIGIVVPEMVTPFYMNFITSIQFILNEYGYRVALAQSHEDYEAELANLKMFEEYRVEGILISACHNTKNIYTYERIMNMGIPMVFFDRTVTQIPVSKVHMDDYIKSFFLVEHMIRTGRKNIVHISGPNYIENSIHREKGFKDALAKFRIKRLKYSIIEAGVEFNDGEQAVAQLIYNQVPFDALFCFTEMQALGAKNYLQKHGIKIPDEVAVGCLSGTALSTLVHPTITSVEQPVQQMAEEAAQLLIERINEPSLPNQDIILSGKMHLRESTRELE